MDGNQFDALARQLSSRRTALGGLLGGLLLPLETVARGKKGKQRKHKDKDQGKDRGNGKGKDKGRGKSKTEAQAEVCWRAGACIPKKGPTLASATWLAMRPLIPWTAPAATSLAPTCAGQI